MAMRTLNERAAAPGPLAAALAAALLIGAAAGGAGPGGEAGEGAPVALHDLLPGVRAAILHDASVRLELSPASGAPPLLEILPPAGGPAAAAGARLFTGRFSEGDPGGRRGFDPGADDDGDGLIDEDRADGRDNDGDGLVDEDFAAIGDEMTVVDISQGANLRRLEAYHWHYAHLRSTLLLAFESSEAGGRAGNLRLISGAGPWRESRLTTRSGPPGAAASRSGQVPRAIHVAALPDRNAPEGCATARLWLGVMRLPGIGAGGAGGVGAAARVDGAALELPLESGAGVLAVSVAPTLLQLRFNLAQAQAVRRGASGGPGGEAVPWIVPPLLPAWMSADAPSAAWRPAAAADEWELALRVGPGDNALVDPDRLRLDGVPLGAPLRIVWRPRDSAAGGWEAPWRRCAPLDPGRLDEARLDPYFGVAGRSAPAGAGELALIYPELPRPAAGRLRGAYLSGREFEIDLTVPLSGPAAGAPGAGLGDEPTVDLGAQLRRSGRPIMLSPDLIENYPNPFRDHTRFRYRVPLTVGEGLVWEEGGGPLPLDPQAAIPYRSGTPHVSVKIYSVSGQEIACLHSGPLAVGQYDAVWSGGDLAGRPVASGTYFCKLQIENWCVTKRVLYLR